MKKVVAVLNEPVPISKGRYTTYSYTEFKDTEASILHSFHWASEHSDFPGIYPLVGMLNTLEERNGGCSV